MFIVCYYYNKLQWQRQRRDVGRVWAVHEHHYSVKREKPMLANKNKPNTNVIGVLQASKSSVFYN